jgi:hypothetical protein
MANYDTGEDILINVLSRADELEIGVAEREEEAKTYIQAAYISVLGEGYPWPFARKSPPGVLTTNVIRDVTATLTVSSANFTFTTAPSGVDLSGRKVWFDGDNVVYRIATYDTGTFTGTFDGIFLNSTGSYEGHVFQDEYNLASDFLRPVSHKFLRPADGLGFVELIGFDEMEGRSDRNQVWSGSNNPAYCAFIGNRKIKIWPWTETSRRYTYHYIYHPGVLTFDGDATTDTPIIQPAEDRVVLSLLAVGNLLVDKNDDRANIFLDAATSKINAMKRLHQAKSRARVWVMPGNNVATGR